MLEECTIEGFMYTDFKKLIYVHLFRELFS